MFDFIRKVALAGVGLFTLTEERARKLVEELVEQGRLSREEGEGLVQELLAKVEASRDEWEGRVRELVQEGFRKLDLVPRKDLERVEAELKALAAQVAELRGKAGA